MPNGLLSNAAANTEYLLIALKDPYAKDIYADQNILYIDQQTSDADGIVRFKYNPLPECSYIFVGDFGKGEYCRTIGDLEIEGKYCTLCGSHISFHSYEPPSTETTTTGTTTTTTSTTTTTTTTTTSKPTTTSTTTTTTTTTSKPTTTSTTTTTTTTTSKPTTTSTTTTTTTTSKPTTTSTTTTTTTTTTSKLTTTSTTTTTTTTTSSTTTTTTTMTTTTLAGTVIWKADSTTVKAGETATVKITVENLDGYKIPVAAAQFKIETALDIIGVSAEKNGYDAQVVINTETGIFEFVADGNVLSKDGAIVVELTIRVPEDYESGEYTVALGELTVLDEEGNDISGNVIVEDGIVTVEAKATTTTTEVTTTDTTTETTTTTTASITSETTTTTTTSKTTTSTTTTETTTTSTTTSTTTTTDITTTTTTNSNISVEGVAEGTYIVTEINKTYELSINNADNVTAESSDEDDAAVRVEDGKLYVTPTAFGSVEITLTDNDTKEEYTFTFTIKENVDDFLLGDVDGDGTISAMDASAALTYYVMNPATIEELGFPFNIKAADWDKNGVIDARDASAILTYYVSH